MSIKEFETQLSKLRKEPISKVIKNKLNSFQNVSKSSNEKWFEELCFCILAANAKAKTSLAIQNALGYKGLSTLNQEKLAVVIRENKHRFHNNKSKYIVSAREYIKIKDFVQNHKNEKQAREWLIKNIKGIGYKEASHFLRNTGNTNLAILDRHIINILVEFKYIERPKSLTPKKYLYIEKKFQNLASRVKMSPAELDLYMWYMKAGEVIK